MSTKPQLSGRLEFVDAMRGMAVLFMLTLHSAHGWLRPEARTGAAWYWINSVGGMAAPLFFLLLGMGMGLRSVGHGAPSTRSEIARGLGLVVLGYLLRVQMWQFDGAAIAEPPQFAAGVVLVAGHLTLLRALRRFGEGTSDPASLALGMALVATGLVSAAHLAPASIPNLLRFDVLQGLGLSCVMIAVLAPMRARTQAACSLAVGAAVLGLTPVLRAWVPGPLPHALAAPIAYWPQPPGAGAPWAMFPLFPWAAYAAFGLALGGHVGRRNGRGQALGPVLGLWIVVGIGLAWSTSEDTTRVRDWLAQAPELTQPFRVGYRVGVGLVLSGLALAVTRSPGWAGRTIVQLGRASLWIYWVHLEFAFGAPSTPIHGRLSTAQWVPLLGTLTLAMVAVARLRVWMRQRTAAELSRPPEGVATNVEQGA